jgi:hypothetical protein
MNVAPLLLLTHLSTAQIEPPPVLEIVDYNATSVEIEALVKLPKLNPAQRYVLDQTIYNLTARTLRYGSRDILRIVKPGTQVRTKLLPDAVRIGLTIDKEELSGGLGLMQSFLTSPSFVPEAYKMRPQSTSNVYESVVIPNGISSVPLATPETSLALWNALVRTNTVSLSVSGNFSPGEPTKKWMMFIDGWQSKFVGNLPLSFSRRVEKPEEGETLVFDYETEKLDEMAKLVFMSVILGGGKQSLLFKTTRERLAETYRQEAFVLPSEKGWILRIALGVEKTKFNPEKIEKLRSEILEEAKKCSEKQVKTSIGLLRGYLQNEISIRPICLGQEIDIANQPGDKIFLRSYYFSKTGRPWNQELFMMVAESFDAELSAKLLTKIISGAKAKFL